MSTHPVENRPNGKTSAVNVMAETQAPHAHSGLTFKRYFTKPGVHPFDEVRWEMRSAVINDERGRPVFEQHDI